MREGELVQDRYKVLSMLGQGGAAAVYEVLDTSTKHRLAMKTLLAKKERHEGQRELRFRREFHTMAGLVHPNIVEVYDYGIGPGGPFYTMELLPGQDLRAMKGCPIDVACSMLRDVASALALLHARCLLHRDVGPRNVRCSGDGAAKLIDFGVLATTGIVGEVAGTPPCMPPESVRRLPLDHKADLFGLGALAYFLLTGRHAYPAKAIAELEAAWAERPPRPSELRPEVPKALDDLVVSMISLDPLGRPSRAAEVIDRLVAIAGLDPTTESDIEAGRGYLRSAALVGRQEEIACVRGAVQAAARGEGSALLFEGSLGEGKSRLLREASLEAQLAGMAVVLASNDTEARAPYGVLREIMRGLVQKLPAEIPAIARERAPIVGRVLPEVLPQDGRDSVPLSPLEGDPRQDRMRLQAALLGLFHDVAARHPLAILVDDVQRADEGSAAVLASLAHSAKAHRLLLVLTLAADEPSHAPAAVGSIQDIATRRKLRGLASDDVRELAGALFGDAPHARLVRWLHEVAGGNPLRVLDLARHLIDRKTLRFVGGLWVIPDELDLRELPPGLAEAMDRKVARLSPAGRALAEGLAVLAGEAPLALCVALAEAKEEQEVFGAIDELVFEEVLLGSGDLFRFRHEGLREALVRGLSEDRKRALHLRVGKALMDLGENEEDRDAEIGLHLYHGGERSRAAPMLARAGKRLASSQSFRDAVPLLEAALAAYEADDAEPGTRLKLRHVLLICGTMTDRAVLLRYADDTFTALRQAGGIDVAERIARYLGKKLGLILGLLVAAIRFRRTPRARRGPSPIAAVTQLGVLVTATATAYSLAFDLDGLRKVLRHIALFTAFPNRVSYAAYLLCECLLAIPLGQWRSVREKATLCLDVMSKNPADNPLDRKNGIATAHYMLASQLASDQDPAFEAEIAEMKKQDLRFFDVSAEMVRLFYHRLRGEEETARAIEARVEPMFVQLGSMWLIQTQRPWVSSFAYAVTHDVLGLKRCIEEMDRLCKAGYRFEPFRDIARGEYYRERGQIARAHEALSRALAALPEEETFRRQRAYAALSEVYLAEGKLKEAQDTAEKALALACEPESIHVSWRLRPGRVVVLATAALGDPKAARERGELLLRQIEKLQSPAMCGAMHETLARVAILFGDRAAFHRHLEETDRYFRGTRNPALVARAERLREAGSFRGAVNVAELVGETVTHVQVAGAPELPPDEDEVSTAVVITGLRRPGAVR